ncbi:Dam family site-specific DNA-(adenine-N6)-methyltransferase [Rouxiella badensis]|uniref:Dam family site-specific DNA-(adenine-N6)-methyltransferase n=1 Tax=Rouxiella badensis TaxID=1646377 RepID=UPI001D1446A5|nr:Dam family site-specific DNA-(adenine-N6)-methyltransferase [Rouxiella badensis]MCC3735961.1 Dam family site-specific DNA-(adenine-N6)-methyltransferase [Rouxiella badensis]MCC3761358.1 Dam family site-specific DNA-(adenine-N6)-methyltransferase [Rouxiella badensis]
MTVSKNPRSILNLDIDAFIAKARIIIHEVFQNKKILSVPDFKKTAANDQDYITKPLTPLYAWAGGKRRLIKSYKSYMPDFKKIKYYAEPFFGAGAMFCEVFNNQRENIKSFHLNDINREIINLLKTIKNNSECFIEELHAIEERNHYKTIDGQKHFYYRMREEYRSLTIGYEFSVKGTAMFYFLLSQMFRGIYTEKNGRINSSFQINKKGFDYENIKNWSVALQRAVITCGSYEKVRVNKDTLLFCDPPYRDCTIMYSTAFDDEEQKKCYSWVQEKVEEKKAVGMLCNKNLNDGFFSSLPTTTESEHINIQYSHTKARVGANRNIVELLMVFKEKIAVPVLKAA